jgi:hypothetical protein
MRPVSLKMLTLVVLMTAAFTHVARAADPVRSLGADPLASWNDGGAKNAVIEFVAKVTKEGSPAFVPPAERIAVFDNDGTLWAEQPLPFQAFFTLDRVKALAPQHPEWRTEEPFASILKGDVRAAFAGGERALVALLIAAFGNSDGDLQMLQWTAAGPGPRFCLYVHHTDADREWAYDRANVGGLEKGLDEAKARGWTVVDMKTDWKRVFAFEKE